MNKYLLKTHNFYYRRIRELTEQVRQLKEKLSLEEFVQHPVVKLTQRVRKADRDIIPQDPDRPEYRLKAELKKFRRYKQGLKRYRLFFSFANHPKIILYLYLNDEKHLRKDGGKNDPYKVFKKFVDQGKVSHDPQNPRIQQWIQDY